MAKRTRGTVAEPDWRLFLAAAVIEYGTRRVVGPYVLTIPKRALRAAGEAGTLAETDLPNGDRLVMYSPPREPPAPKPKR